MLTVRVKDMVGCEYDYQAFSLISARALISMLMKSRWCQWAYIVGVDHDPRLD
jgi:hypothetical protein